MPKGKTHFGYFRDRYAFKLLEFITTEKKSVGKIKSGPFAKLLRKPAVKEFLSRNSSGTISAQQLNSVWLEPSEQYLLTLSTWDASEQWAQSSRKGVNLVLQLNFSNKHRQQYLKYIKPNNYDPFIDTFHPVMQPNQRELYRDTLGWSRIDLDIDNNEALIEEIQTDWLRDAKNEYKKALKWIEKEPKRKTIYNCDATAVDVKYYFEHSLLFHADVWSEAILLATIEFMKHEVGIDTIYYHTFDSGKILKRIDYSAPPRSLYTTLPKRFCFELSKTGPEFLELDKQFKRKKKILQSLEWHKLKL